MSGRRRAVEGVLGEEQAAVSQASWSEKRVNGCAEGGFFACYCLSREMLLI